MVVAEVFSHGHRNLGVTQLEYVRDMANRVGFTVLEPITEMGPDVARIRLQISMTNPVFVARLQMK